MSTDHHTPAVTTNLDEVRRADEELDAAITAGGGGSPSLGDAHNITGEPIVSTSPDYPPSAMDDEFDDGSLNLSLWDVRDPEANLTYYEGRYGLVLTRLAVSAYWAGLYQALPAGNFTAWTKVGFTAQRKVGVEPLRGAGFALTNDPTANECHIVYVTNSSGVDFRKFSDTGNTLNPAGSTFSTLGVGGSIIIRLRRNGTNWWFESSPDGIVWQSDNDFNLTPQTETNLDFPTYIGLALFGDDDETALDMRAVFRYFRYVPYDVGILHILNEIT